MFRIEHNVETGEIRQIQLSDEEIAILEKEKVEFEKRVAEQENAEAKRQAQRQALLSRLGITEEEARILLGGN